MHIGVDYPKGITISSMILRSTVVTVVREGVSTLLCAELFVNANLDTSSMGSRSRSGRLNAGGWYWNPSGVIQSILRIYSLWVNCKNLRLINMVTWLSLFLRFCLNYSFVLKQLLWNEVVKRWGLIETWWLLNYQFPVRFQQKTGWILTPTWHKFVRSFTAQEPGGISGLFGHGNFWVDLAAGFGVCVFLGGWNVWKM